MQSTEAAGPGSSQPWSDARWLAWLCLSRLSFSLIFTVYSAVLPLVKDAWGMSAAQAGLVQSSWHAGYVVSLFVAGRLSERYGAKAVFLGMSYAACASAALFALLADGFWSALLLYGLAAVCSGGSYTPGLTLIAERFEPGRRGRAMGWYLAAASTGYAIALLGAGAVSPLAGWRVALVGAALATVAGALIARRVLRDTKNLVTPPAPHEAGTSSLLAVWRNRPARLAILAYAFHCYELLGMWAWLPAFLAVSAAAGGSGSAGALGFGVALAGLAHLVGTIGSLSGGSLSDRYGRTAVMLGMGLVSLVISFAFGWLLAAPLWLLTVIAVVYNITAIGDSSVYSTALTELVPHRLIGPAYAVRSVLGFGMAAIAPWVFGLVLDFGTPPGGEPGRVAWGLAFTSLAVGALLGPWMSWQLRRTPEGAAMANGKG